MNIEENLILIKGEDKTEKVITCVNNNGKCLVTFDNNKTYTYSSNNVKWFRNPIEINAETTIIYENNGPISGVVKIFKFEEHIRVCFKSGYKKLFNISDILMEKTSLNNKISNNYFEYLKKLAANVSITLDDESSFLSKQYNKIKIISPRSVLSSYLKVQALKKRKITNEIIFPFGFNISQKSATEKALSNQISVIEGPPGTGKTQTILNIIANAIINNETVAVVSNNNSATANVLEKLQKYDVGFISAYLGNKENKDEFFESQKDSYPDMKEWKIENEKLEILKSSLMTSKQRLDDMLHEQNKLATLKEEFSELDLEVEYFNKYYDENKYRIQPYRSIYKLDSNDVMSILAKYEIILGKYGLFKLRHKIINIIRYGIISFKFYKNSNEAIVDYLKKVYYELKSSELSRTIDLLSNKLEKNNFEDLMRQYSEDSMQVLKSNLARKFTSKGNRTIFTKDILWKNIEGFLKEYPVILSTTHSLRSCVSENYLFDYVIVDEASQVDIVTGSLALSCAKNVVIVGDLKQLPNVVTDEVKNKSDIIFKQYNLNEAFNYAQNSLLSSITKLYSDVPKTLLREHYRCHPKIIGFCNKKFYNNELIILTNESVGDKPLVVYKTSKGNHARGNFNQRQIDVILDEVIPKLNLEKSSKEIGVISPYRLQVDELKKLIKTDNIEVDTVHKYQGREKDTIILTTVANQINDFIDDPNLINVAVSRAESKLILIVSDSDIASDNTNIGDLIKYIQYNNFEIINSNISSVFDFLYSNYSKKLLEILNKNKRVSEFASENLMNMVIEKVLCQEKFKFLDVVLHQPLKMLIKDTSKLTEIEHKFVKNILTHTDFIIFNKLDKMPVLVVEVDGYAFHANNKVQLERDKMKDEILTKYNIPILRISTNGSGEELKLSNKLSEVLKIKF
ncbi:AAA domain-containing protein [Clostridium estertheticum]|uniref:DNA helicase n=1 Tax=Clostridium estertheticum subsp. estertheticum TaxID=1552 RepID=A0A1J0GGK3_9CLOT|nr:AAA domain-containing protein [Clostridium estertheticum]APC40038.1 DNA helicase [Clostridium estertheticum subsp. estertheticum]MBZ9618192.1 AAA family ATPase [Clostridium estertheticum subsp. laramiense]WAG73840.1 AAA domain-containing protein [Clostridium estertheticum]